MRTIFPIILLFFNTLISVYAQKNEVASLFSAEKLKTASYSVYAIDANSGERICSTDQKSLSTASVMKLFTTAVALDLLGPDYTFTTSLFYSGNIDPQSGTLAGNLIIKGGGDPAFYSSFFQDHYKDCFENWILQMKKNGIEKISGNLLIDLSFIKSYEIPGGWGWDDIGNYYGAGVSALSYHDNQYEIHFSSAKTEGVQTVIGTVYPEIDALKLENHVHSSFLAGDHTIVYGAPGSNHQTIEGTIPTGQSDFIVRAAMPDPPLIAANAFLKKMKESGILFSGIIKEVPAGDHAQKILLAIQDSPLLKELIVPLNKESINVYAEHLLCEIGRKSSGEPTTKMGLKAYHRYCAEEGIDTLGFFPADGSGLSRSNSLTTKTLVETLKHIYDSKYRELLVNALPIAGVDGTLRNSFKGTVLEKNVTAKTGSMERVRSLAGLLHTRSNKTLLFAVIINNFDLKSSESSKLLESVLLSLYNE